MDTNFLGRVFQCQKEYINGLWKKPLGYSNASFSDRGVLSSSPVGSDEQRQTAHGQVGWKIPRICLMETQEKCSDEIGVLWSQQGHCTKDLNAHDWHSKPMLVICWKDNKFTSVQMFPVLVWEDRGNRRGSNQLFRLG